MMKHALLLSTVAGLLALAPSAAVADSYAAACARHKGVPVSECTCEGRIAAKVLDRAELQAAIAILRGREAQFKAMVAKMGAAKAAAFSDKMDVVGTRTDAECAN